MVRLKGAYCQVKVSYGCRNGKGGKVVHNAETSKARLGLWSFLTKWDSFGDKTAMFWIVSWTTLSKHLQASNGYVQSLTCSNGYNGLSTAMDFTSDSCSHYLALNTVRLQTIYQKLKPAYHCPTDRRIGGSDEKSGSWRPCVEGK